MFGFTLRVRDTAVILLSQPDLLSSSVLAESKDAVAYAELIGANVGFLTVQQFAWLRTTCDGASSDLAMNKPLVSTSGAIVSSENRCLSSGFGFLNAISSLANWLYYRWTGINCGSIKVSKVDGMS